MTRPATPTSKARGALTPPDPLKLLARDDKWHLGGAPALLYAPPTPVWDEALGFWDEAHYLHFALQPVFTFALIDEQGSAITLTPMARRWQPHLLERQYHAEGVELEERKTCGPDDILGDAIVVRNNAGQTRELRLVVWTAQPVADETFRRAEQHDEALVIERVVPGLRNTSHLLALALHLEEARSWSLDLAETCALHPHYHFTPYQETLTRDGLPNRANLSGVNFNGLVFAALERPISLDPGDEVTITIRAAVAPTVDDALHILERTRGQDLVVQSERAWRDYFASVPRFACSDPHIETYYYYRWFGLRLNTFSRPLGNYAFPAVAEGLGYFRVPIAYSAQAHMRETRWMREPELAWGSLLIFVANQREDGSFPNHVHVDYIASEGIYHADWGAVALAVHDVHPDLCHLEATYHALERYLLYFYRERDPQASGLYDHVNQWESGQEYMSRYVWVDDEGDHWKALKRRLKGIDATTYIYRCEQAMVRMSELLGTGTAARWRQRAEHTGNAILNRAWRRDLQAFVDLSPELEPSELVFAVSFYPFFTDLVTPEHLPSLYRHLLNPDEFWTLYPIPASPKTDPCYSATPVWRGKRTNCPWNGRTWPMTNSHIAEALACASELDPELRDATAEFITRFVCMMFFDGDPTRPNSFEHYNPETGAPSRYRGFDDYMHSWVVDLLIKYVAGVRPEAGKVVIDPFPFGVSFALEGVQIRGHELDIRFDTQGFLVHLDGRVVHEGRVPERLLLNLP